MNVVIEKEKTATVIEIHGRLDGSNCSAADQEIKKALASGDKAFVLDCSDLQYISSAGLRLVVQVLKALKARGGSLVVCGLSDSVREVFEISGFLTLLTIADSRAAAAEAACGS